MTLANLETISYGQNSEQPIKRQGALSTSCYFLTIASSMS